jgi:hypothetical protein
MSESEEAAFEEGGEGRRTKERRGLEAVALRELRRARKLFKDGEPTPEANFVVASANVLALLELAAAIRDHKDGSGEGE